MAFYGMDTAQGEDFAQLMATRRGDAADRVAQLASTVSGIGSSWIGPDADAFQESWNNLRSGRIEPTLERIMELARDLAAQAQAQDVTSAADALDAAGEWLRDIFRISDDAPSILDFLPSWNDWEDVLGSGIAGILDGIGGALTGFTKFVMNPRTLVTLFAAGGDDAVRAWTGAAGAASRLSRVLGPVGLVATAGFAGWDRWEQDSADPSLSTGERITRAVVDGGANAAGAGLGAWGGAAGGAALGTMICPGIGTVVGGVIGGIAGGLLGGGAANGLVDWLLG
ncbi:WXG100 family type VII secretion target [Brachybacterium hainanense]|uniref:WXG100 family type VII secretion target n=1 Tax=Brachybacterium hainanense TaxID=1541174 RepID=A0ABV6R603_9MICO